MQWFSYLHKREVLQQEYYQSTILPSPHFRWVVNVHIQFTIFPLDHWDTFSSVQGAILIQLYRSTLR